MMGVHFRSGGAAPLFDFPISNLCDLSRLPWGRAVDQW